MTETSMYVIDQIRTSFQDTQDDRDLNICCILDKDLASGHVGRTERDLDLCYTDKMWT